MFKLIKTYPKLYIYFIFFFFARTNFKSYFSLNILSKGSIYVTCLGAKKAITISHHLSWF